MGTKRLGSVGIAILSMLLCHAAVAATVYRWVDSDGTVRFTTSKPMSATAYEAFEVPDPVRWYNAPQMPGEVPGASVSSTNLFKALSKSVYAVIGHVAGGTVYGSAVAITDKLAITNCHILEDAGEDIYLSAGPDESMEQLRIEGADYEADRCVVAVQRMDLHPVAGIRRFDAIEVGETVYAIGNPLRLERTLSDGLLSAKRVKGERRYLQTTAAISPGSSGGGLFDAKGNLIGITSFTLRGAQSINFAIPAEDYWK